MKILSVEQTREADRYTLQREQISSLKLMERAAHQVSKRLLDLYPGFTFLIFAGPGNNGGDGLVIARYLAQWGQDVQVYTYKEPAQCSPDFQANWSILHQRNLRAQLVPSELLTIPLGVNQVVVDALLGSGLQRVLQGKLLELVQYLNQNPGPRVAIDIPTGMPADTYPSGNAAETIFQATQTLSLGHPKRAMLHRAAASLTGKLEVTDIGLDPKFYLQVPGSDFYLTRDEIRKWCSVRPWNGYKGTFGHACIWAGSPQKGGAALLAGEAALRSGCGLLTVAIPNLLKSAFWTRLPEAMQVEPEEIPPLQGFQALGCGPGLGMEKSIEERLERIARESGPQVWDADALNHLAQNADWLELLAGRAVLTPHIGEWKRLMGQNNLPQNYPEQLRHYAQKYQLTVLLKDHISIIATARGELFFAQFGNTALAQGGSGDILTGLVTGLLAQSYSPLQACAVALFVQGMAAKGLAQGPAEAGLRITDILQDIPGAWNELAK